jgi:hypothetical protein
MSKQGMKIALEVGKSRMKFDNFELAEKYFENVKKNFLEKINKLQDKYKNEKLDFSPESLKTIEKIYFDYYEKDRFNEKDISKNDFIELLGIYNGFVYVINEKAKWKVEKEVFVNDDRYYLGIELNSWNCFIDCSGISHLEKLTNNKRRQSMYREYKKYANQ